MKTKRTKKKKLKWQCCVKYNIFFVLGFVWFALGMLYDNITLFALGTVFVIIGVTKRKKVKPLSEKEKKNAILGIAILVVLLFLGIVVLFNLNSRSCVGINSFEDCAAAGYPVMESYPRQCRVCGITFVEEVGKKNCVVDEDCVVFGKTGDCGCDCYNKNSPPIITGDKCFCMAPTSCKCVDSECEGIFE